MIKMLVVGPDGLNAEERKTIESVDDIMNSNYIGDQTLIDHIVHYKNPYGLAGAGTPARSG